MKRPAIVRIASFAAVTALVLGAGLAHRLVAQQEPDWEAVKIEAIPAAGQVRMLTGLGGNMALMSGPDGALLVDDQYPPLADKIRAAVKEMAGAAPAFILNTHYHGDHTGGNEKLSADAVILAHDNVRARLESGHQPRGGEPRPAPQAALPVVTYGDSITIHFNGEAVRVQHYPHGHTDGDSIVFFTGSNVVHMGDHMFAGRFPFVDLGAGGSVQGAARNTAAVLAQIDDDTKLIPGHGPLSTKQDLEAYVDMLQSTLAHVQAAMDAGKSLDQIKEAGLPEKWDEWGTGFIKTDRWIETIHVSLSR